MERGGKRAMVSKLISTCGHVPSQKGSTAHCGTYVVLAEFLPASAFTERLMQTISIVAAIPTAIAASSAGSHLLQNIEIASDKIKNAQQISTT